MRRAAVVTALLLLAGCAEDARPAPLPSSPPASAVTARPTVAPSSSAPVLRLPVVTAPVFSGGWEITVYYTAVEDYHSGDPVPVTGCRGVDCSHGDDDLGSYREDFVAAVQEEGTGRTAGGTYLNWSYDIGFWLDTRPRDTGGRALRPFVSAAADPGVLARGVRFRISDCGHADDGSRPAAAVCAALRDARWTVTDEFTPGLGGTKHIDAYIGEETGPDFTSSPWYLTLRGVTIRRG
ncbi:hypothetical protein [Nucisporomicrobium flavum]|uniref:hypothetical protein n=1 Tax=Nucisporomicrobium flavum TaxID=2785915 RepID=UPI0018F5BE00|nr:hypothetical protein [Nucisporomicrobium flavum]